MRLHRVPRPLPLVAVLALWACGGDGSVTPTDTPSTTPPPVQRLLAVGLESIESFTVDAGDGRLVPAPALTVPSRPISAVVTPSGERLYLATLNGLEGFRMDLVAGRLTPLPGSPYARVSGLALAPSGAFLYARTNETTMIAYRVEASGALVEVGSTPVPRFQSGLEFEPGGRFAYGPAGLMVAGYRVEASGVLTTLPGSPYPFPSSDPNGGPLLTARVGPFFYSLTPGLGSLPGGVRVFRFDPVSGIPEQIVRYRTPDESKHPTALALSPSGGTLYVSYTNRSVADTSSAFVQAYAVDGATGFLGATGRLDVGLANFSLMRVSPDGRSVFLSLQSALAEQRSAPTPVVSIRLDASGQLIALAGTPQPAGTDLHSLLAFAR